MLVITDENCPPTDFQSAPWNTASLVTPQHAVRRLWNEEALHKFSSSGGKVIISCKAEDIIKGEQLTLREQYALAAQGSNSREKGKQQWLNQDLPDLIEFTVGMKVMVTQNVETDLDITNGVRGTIVGIILHPDEPISRETEHTELKLQNLPLYILVKMGRT